MAGFDIDFPDDMFNGLLNANTEDLCKEMINEAAPILRDSMQKEMIAVMSNSGVDSEMVKSVKASKAKITKDGAAIAFIGPKGNSTHYYYAGKKRKRKYQVSNILKAIWLNYGRNGQPARPFLTKAANQAEAAVIAKMQEVYNRRMGGGT